MMGGDCHPFSLTFALSAATLWAAGSFPWHYLLWGGLAALLVAPAILSRTRWSESRPLATCVGVSVLAHMLLMIYAYATRLPYADFRGQGDGDGGVVSLHLLAEDESPDDNEPVTDEDDGLSERSPDELRDDTLPTPEEMANKDMTIPPDHGADANDSAAADTSRATAGGKTTDRTDSTDRMDDADRLDGRESDSVEDSNSIGTTASVPSAVVSSPSIPTPPIPTPPIPTPPIPTPPIPTPPIPSPAIPLAAGALVANAAARQSTVPESADIDAADLQSGEPTSDGTQPPAPSPGQLADSLVNPSPAAVAAAAEMTAVHMVARSVPPDESFDVAPIRPGDGRPVPVLYRNRQASRRLSIALQHGGNANTEAAVNGALDWLARHQAPDGRWDADAHGAGQEARIHGHDRGGAGAHADTGITALAVLAFLGAGETHLVGAHREHVQHGLEFLLRNQRTDGELAGSAELFARMYCHSMATLALSEAYAMTGDPRIRPFLERAVRYSLAAQDPATGGWRYRPGDAGDMSQFGWQLMSLKSAQQAGLEVPQASWLGMRRFVDSVTSGPQRGLASYRPGERPSRTMTAEALFCRVFLDMHQESQVKEAMAFVLQELPADRSENLYYWYYATLAAFQTQGDGWPAWNDALQRQLLARQRTGGDLNGSWDPDEVWGKYGGRVFSTSLSALCLEVYYRYLPLYQTAAGTHAGPGERR